MTSRVVAKVTLFSFGATFVFKTYLILSKSRLQASFCSSWSCYLGQEHRGPYAHPGVVEDREG